MKPKSVMLIAGETSGDLLAAELVHSLRDELTAAEARPTTDYQPLRTSLEPRFFGAGGPRMAAEGVDLAFDMTVHSVIGISDALKNVLKFKRLGRQLFELARRRQPDAIICVDFAGFNRRFAHAIKEYTRRRRDWFHDWRPKLIQYISPQVWASREGRAYQMAKDYDLVLSIFPFEKEWYAKRVPKLRVEFVGHPILDRYQRDGAPLTAKAGVSVLRIVVLPGSRRSELSRHLPVMLAGLEIIRATLPGLEARLVLPNESMLQLAQALDLPTWLKSQVGELPAALRDADVAIASTGTVTTECAYFGVPTVALYKTSWSTYHIGRRLVKVKYLAMPNLLANEEVFPEFIQQDASPQNLAAAAIDLLQNVSRRAWVKAKLAEAVSSLGEPGATRRAAQKIAELLC